MMKPNKYPHLKVFFAFWFMPFVFGLAAGPVVFVATLAQLFSNPRALGEVHGLELWMVFVTTPILAQVVYLLPALGFALYATLCAFSKGRRTYTIIGLSGGAVAFVWLTWLDYLVMRGSAKGFVFTDNALALISAFFIGAAACALMALIALPEPTDGSKTGGLGSEIP